MRRTIRPSVRRRREWSRYAGRTVLAGDVAAPLGPEAMAAAERAGWLAEGELLLTEAPAVEAVPALPVTVSVQVPVTAEVRPPTDRSAHVLAKIGPVSAGSQDRSAAA